MAQGLAEPQQDAAGKSAVETSGKTVIENVYAALRTMILSGELAPDSRLRVEEIRARFGVGSSTVREALSRLLADNLVETQGQRGFHVTPVSIDDFSHVCELRSLLESSAVRDSIRNGDDDWEGALVAAHHRLAKIEKTMPGAESEAASEWEARNRAFHDTLVAACTNRWLLNFRDIVYSQSERYRRISITTPRIPRDVRAEHQAIFDAAIARDAEEAVRLTVGHISKSIAALRAHVAVMER